MCNRFTFSETKEYIERCGFIVLDDYIEDVKIGTRFNVIDCCGYKYYIARQLLYKRKVDGSLLHLPEKFAAQNPYTIENIKLWISKNNKPFEYIRGEYVNNESYLVFKCNVCHSEWDNPWYVISLGIGCPYCNGKRINHTNNLAKYRPDLIDEWDSEKNGDLTPYNVSPRSEKRIWWKCANCSFSWDATPANRNAPYEGKATNCPRCKRSHGELEVENFLLKHGFQHESQYAFADCKNVKSLVFDFYLPKNNCCIEYNGIQHYIEDNFFNKLSPDKFKIQQLKDGIKREYCRNNGIKLIEIPYWDISIIEEILYKNLCF